MRNGFRPPSIKESPVRRGFNAMANPIDTSPISIAHVDLSKGSLAFKDALTFTPTMDRNLILVLDAETGIYAFAETRDQLIEEIHEQLRFMWLAYAMEDDYKLTQSAIAFNNNNNEEAITKIKAKIMEFDCEADPGDPHSTKTEGAELTPERAYYYGELRETFSWTYETTSRFVFSCPASADPDSLMDRYAYDERGGGDGADGDYESSCSRVESLGAQPIPEEHFNVMKLYLPDLTISED